MDQHNAPQIVIPDLKLAKVGGGPSERKRAGAGWIGVRGAGSGFGALGGGAGAGGGLWGSGMSLAKLLVILAMAGSISAGAWTYGSLRASDAAPGKNGKLFADKNSGQPGDASRTIRSDKSVPNSLGYVSGSTDGMTPEERAKKQAEADAARQAAADAKSKADAGASDQASVPAAAGASAVAAQAPVPTLSPGKFGQLTSNSGGGASGGAGSSAAPNGGPGAGNALGGSVKPQNGGLSGFRSAVRPGMTASAHATASKSKSQGFAKGQLDNAFAQSRQATAGGAAENAAATAGAPFDNNSTIGGTIGGPGAGGAAQPTTWSNAPSNPSTGGGGGSGPLAAGTAACPSGQEPDSSGVCQSIQTPTAVNGSKDQWMIDAVKALMVVLGVLSALYMIVFAMAKADAAAAVAAGLGTPLAAAALLKLAHDCEALSVIGKMILGTGIAITVMGIAYMAATGDILQGGIITAVGAMATVLALVPVPVMQLPVLAAGELITAAGGYMATAASQPGSMQ